ncbi:glycosyltransferase family 9 protein [Streptomonospora nanhaiensis]|nr:glycosyltransferase family 9 protein [Streptomonospora nanhaiensis]MBV2366223.1 hypothetical protein [Streptomonospora nanhaiensis]MBX9386954.1 hypothetical protein [Streptomonospora nanhaiensis]
MVGAVTTRRGGRVVVPRAFAPLAPCLPYRRAEGQHPPAAGAASEIQRSGWSVVLGERGLGDSLLALGLLNGLLDGTSMGDEAHYTGPRPRLMQRCRLPLATEFSEGPHIVHSTGNRDDVVFRAVPEDPKPWLDLLDTTNVEVHDALPMRYYLEVEQRLGIRLPADRSPLPSFASGQQVRRFHVVFITATSWPTRKDYNWGRFAHFASLLTARLSVPWSFTLITGKDPEPAPCGDIDVLAGIDAVDCLDVFASAEVVIGNDTGLTHLAALTERSDGTAPQVVGLYGRHSHTKWTTGRSNHHAIATPFSQMLAAADRCPVRDQLDDALWSDEGLGQIPETLIADFIGSVAGWW